MSSPLAERPVRELKGLLDSGALTSEALVNDCLTHISLRNPKIHAFLRVNADEALALAKTMDQERQAGQSVGLLGGFTTFSAFGWETLSLLRDGRVLVSLAYVTASVGCSLIAAWLAWALFGSG